MVFTGVPVFTECVNTSGGGRDDLQTPQLRLSEKDLYMLVAQTESSYFKIRK